jgi:hypothetical protein
MKLIPIITAIMLSACAPWEPSQVTYTRSYYQPPAMRYYVVPTYGGGCVQRPVEYHSHHWGSVDRWHNRYTGR